MNIIQKFTIAVASSLLVACGGGGGGGDSNPLAKYAGTYQRCDDAHSKETAVLTAVGEKSINITYVEETYENANCTGAVVGTYRIPLPITATFELQTTAILPPATILPSTGTVDRVTLVAPAMTATLTGSGVNGRCVSYPGGQACYDSLTIPAETISGALYKLDQYLVTFALTNGVLEFEDIYSTDASFKYSMLSPD